MNIFELNLNIPNLKIKNIMRKYNKNYFSNIPGENLNKNTPNTPYRKNSLLKEPNLKINQKYKNNKGEIGNNNTKKNFKLYSSSILINKNNIENKNHDLKMKDIKSFSNSREYKNHPHSKNIFNNDYNINLNNKNHNNKKKTDYLFFFENLKIKKTQYIKPNNEKNADNQNKINKTQSFINNDNLSYNSFNYITNTVKNAVISSVKKPNSKSKNRPSSLLLQKKLKEENKVQSKAKPMSLLQSSKERKQKSKEKNQSKHKDVIKKNFQINTTHFNYYNNCQVSNSNFFLKNKIFFNKTCNNDLYNNNLINSEKNSNPIIIKKKFIKYEQNNKNEEAKKSQSLSHIFSQKTKNDNIFKNRSQKKEKRGLNLSSKKILKNKTTNFNLNINNINNFNNKFLFNCNSLNKSSPVSTNKSQVINIKYPSYEVDKKNVFYNDINNYKFDLVNLLNNLPEEYTKDKLFIKIINLWNELGGINSPYIESFIKYTINNEDKIIIFENEINELSLIIKMINSIKEKIKTRNELLTKIKSVISINNNNFNEVKQLLTFLTNISMNIILEYNSFIKEISLDILLKKYNIERINNFDINYLSKMESDSNFLMNNPNLNKIFKFDKNYPSLTLINNENENINQQINICKYSLFKYKIYQDLLLRNENYINNPTNINLDLEKYFSINSNNPNANNNENYKSNNSIEINKNNIEQDKEIKENNINLEKESKSESNNESNKNTDSGKKDNEKNRNDLLYNYNNFNSFTFGRENKLPKIKDEDVLIISPYNPRKDPKLVLLYTSYLSSINEKMRLSFNINDDIYYYLNIGIYPKIILFKDSFSNVKAFCTLSYEHNLNSDKKILTITNISCMNEYKISKILLSLVDYCKNSGIYFDSIEINLYYIKKEGNFILDQEYENEIKKEAKFKWVKLENDGEKRKIKYHYVNDNLINNNIKENTSNNDNKISNDINPTMIGINIINYSLIKYYQEFGYENITYSEYSQLYMIINFLKKYYLVKDSDNEINEIIENLKGIKLKKIIRILSEYCHRLSTIPKDFKNDFCKDNCFNKDFLNSFIESIEKNKNKEDDLLCLNYYNIFTNFSNIIKIEIDGYEYNIISMNNYLIEAFNIDNDSDEDMDENYKNFNIYDNNENIKDEKDNVYKNEMLYFIKSEKDDISFIFYELPDNKEAIEQKDIESLFNKVLKKILVKDNEEPIKSYKKICIPSFSYKKINSEKENFEDNMNDKLKIIECDLISYFEEINFCTENLSNNEIKFSFPLSRNIDNYDDIKIIKNNFVMAIINPDLVLDYHLPAMNIFYISKNNWVKINK